MSGIGVVLNPKSRRNLRDPGAAVRLARRLGDHGVLRTAGSVEELYRIAEDFRRVDIDVLAISGGDGTGHVTLTGFLNVYGGHAMPHVALLRGGTMNTVANSVGVRPGRPEGLLGRLVANYAQRATAPLAGVERHVMQVEPLEPQASRTGVQYGFLFGTGVVHGFLAEYYRDGEPTPLVAARTLARGIGSALVKGEMIRRMAKPFRGSVALDDGTAWEERDYLAIAAGTIEHIGLNFKPFYRYDQRPRAFQVLGIHASPVGFVKELPRIHKSRPMRSGKAYDALASRMIVRSADGRMRYMIDGDLHETRGELAVSIGPRVRLVTGQ
ncbi:MAG TPA: diacylglycerol kinase family protein [Polyangiaceae bacterium]|jgi:diacylglycerol kinase family enzyme|nr:diacylglycerol kinase family protein [Polyangiaceae bacterium]